MSSPRVYEWVRQQHLADIRVEPTSLSWDLGEGTLIRLIYEIDYMADPDVEPGWEQVWNHAVWAVSDTAPNPMPAGVDAESVLSRELLTAWDSTTGAVGYTPPRSIERDIAVRRVLASTDLLWFVSSSGISTLGMWINLNIQALMLRP